MRIEIEKRLPDDLIEEGWQLYNVAFDELRSRAARRHVMLRHEFEATMRDARVLKFLAFDHDDTMRGVSTYTNELDAMQMISPDYFRRRWPAEFEDRRIWYIGFVGVHPASRHTGLYETLVAEMVDTFGGRDCVVAMDVCRRNEEIGFPQGTHRLLLRLYGDVEAGRMDEQSYWYFDFSAATPRRACARTPVIAERA